MQNDNNHSEKNVQQLPKMLNIDLLYDPTILLPKEMKTYVHKNPSTQIFKVALFVIGQNWR